MKPFSVYVLEGPESWYVGSAWNKTTAQKRLERHLSGRGNAALLWDAIQSGIDFQQTILESGYGESQLDALDAEERWIAKYIADDPRKCLNINLCPSRLNIWSDDEFRNADIKAILSVKAKDQMNAQWERKREESGTDLGYFGKMTRLHKARGSASDYQCVNCSGMAKCWTQIHDTDGLDVENDFQPMCKPCSARYNGFRQRQIEATTPEERSTSAKSMWAKRSPEERSAIAKKAWETKHAKGYSGPSVDPSTGRFVSSVDIVVESDSDSHISGNRN